MYCSNRISLNSIFSSIIILILSLGILAGNAYSEMSEQDYINLQQKSLNENWTFQVSRTDAFFRPPNLPAGPGLQMDLLEIPTGKEDEGKISIKGTPSVLPDSWNWCDWGICSTIKDQGACGGCFAFSAMGIFESAILLNDLTEVDLSEQWAISCTGAGNCVGGGAPGTVLNYTLCNALESDACGGAGAVLEADFPFAASDVACTNCPYDYPYCTDNWSLVDWYNYMPNVNDVKRAIIEHGPVSVQVAADAPFMAYGGGVFNACSPASVLNHYVILVGWDDNQGANGVWILRNSWGTRWGEDADGNPWDFNNDGVQDSEGGYMRIEYGCNSVGWVALYMEYQDSNEGLWLDFTYSGTEDGSFWSPLSSLQNAINQVAENGNIRIKHGGTSETIRITKPMTISAANGNVTIGE